MSARTDYGLPGVYNSSAITLPDGAGAALALNASGQSVTDLGTKIAGEDLTVDVLKVEERFTYNNIITNTTTTVKSGAGFLHSIVVNTTSAGAVTIYDNTAGSGTKIGTMKASIAEGTYIYDVSFATGLTIVTAGASDLTISYR